MKTYQPKQKEIKRDWHLIDANDQILGRLSTKVAVLLMGKQKVSYSNHMDSGDFVVVVNAEKIKTTGTKALSKVYRSHSGYPGGFKEVTFAKMAKEHPNRIVEFAIAGMLPDNRLKADRMARLFVFKGEKHKYENKFK
jgi:large subunit ribosomal protein L13